MLCATFPAFLLLLQLVSASPGAYNYGFDTRHALRSRRSTSTFAITGVQSTTNGSLPIRREIRNLEQDNTTWTLYLLGMSMFQYMNQTELLSWYQIAGIHGRPFTPWDGVKSTPGNEDNGYCNHVSIVFATWHRPYLALYEQALYNIIQFIASLYPEGSVRDQYVAAADNFRIPYWDWAAVPPAGQHTVPDSITGSENVAVDGPNGVQTIHNPLFSYVFKPLDPAELPDAPMNVWPQTLRWPTNDSATAASQNDQMAEALDNGATSFRSRLYNLFTVYGNYTEFGTEAYSNSLYYDSIESVHDYIHGYTGNGGHMAYIEYAAFDPIFFLHHAMIDRCFALWQVLYPDSWVEPETCIYGTFTTSVGQVQDANSPLTPFHDDMTGDFWTSNSARNTSTFGYVYPETATSPGGNMTAQVINAINDIYGTTSPSNLVTRNNQYTVRRSLSELHNRDLAANTSTNLPADILQGDKYREWIANIRVAKYALSAPFFIHIFLGSFNPDPSAWYFEPNLVGTHCIFTKTPSGMDQSCNPEQIVSGTVPLTSALLADIEKRLLGSLDPAEVVPYLSQNLRYKISMMDGTEGGTVDSLAISVVSAEVDKFSDGELPKWGEMQTEVDEVPCG